MACPALLIHSSLPLAPPPPLFLSLCPSCSLFFLSGLQIKQANCFTHVTLIDKWFGTTVVNVQKYVTISAVEREVNATRLHVFDSLLR